MKRKFWSVLLILAMLCTNVIAFAETSGTHGDKLTWTLSDEGVLTISGSGEMEGYVYPNPFEEHKADIKKVVIAEGVTAIGDNSFFGFENITEVDIADSVTRIGDSAFSDCSSLKTVEWGNSVETIGNSAFWGTALESVELPLSVKSIESDAFSNCASLTVFSMPSDIENVGARIIAETPFYNEKCPEGSTDFYLGDVLIMVDTNATSYTIKSGTRVIAGAAFISSYNLTGITIPDSVEYVCDEAFRSLDDLASVTFGSGVKKIGYEAFYNSGLTSVNIPASVEVIGSGAFGHCESLTTVTLNEGLKSIGRQAFSLSALTEIIIPDSVVNVDHAAFSGCDSLKTMVIGDGVTYFESGSFDCSTLESITIGDSLTGFTSTNSLRNADALKEIVIGDGFRDLDMLKSLPNPALLESITVGSGVTTIEQQIFTKLTGLKNIDLSDNVLIVEEGAFTNTAYYKDSANWEGNDLYVDNCLVDVKAGTTSIDVKEGTVCIGTRAFYNTNSTLSSVTLPDSLKSINEMAFQGCSKLNSITLPDGLIEIGHEAFSRTGIYNDKTNWDNGKFYIGKYLVGCDKTVTDYTIKDGTLCIAGKAFYKAVSNFKSVVVPDSVVSLSKEAFAYSTYLTSVTLGKNVKHIGVNAFSRCSITTISLPQTVEWIGEGAFNRCQSLTYAEVNGGSIEKEAFANCIALETVILGNNVTFIGYFAFNSCSALTKISIPDSVTSISEKAFSGCSALKRISVGSGLKFLSDIVYNTSAVDLVLTKNTIQIDCSMLHDDGGTLENIYYSGNRNDWNKIIHSTHYATDTVYPVIHFGVENPPDVSAVAVSGNGVTAPVSVSIALENHEAGGDVLVALIKDGIVIDVVTKPAAAVVDAAFSLGDTGTQVFVFWWESADGVTPLAEMVAKDI